MNGITITGLDTAIDLQDPTTTSPALQQDTRQRGRFWSALGDFLLGATQPRIPGQIVDTAPPPQPQNNVGQIAGYATLGVITLGSVALLIYLIGKK